MSLHSTSTSSSEEASDQKIGRSKSASTTIEFLKRELEKYKSSVAELVDEVLFAENQLSVRDDTIKKLKSEIHRMTELNSQKDMKINDLLLAPPLPPPPQIIHEVKNSDTISHYEFRMSQMENEIKNYRELYDKAKEQIDLFEQERNLIEEENHNLSSDLNTLYAEKHMALLEIEKLKALLEQASKPQMQQQQQQHHHHHHMNQTQDITKFIDTTRPNEILDMIESEDQLDVPMRDEEKKLLDKLQEVLHNTDINSFLSDSAKTVSKFEDTLSSFKEKLEEANMNREEEFMTLLKSQEDQLITLSVENSELKKKLQFLEDNNREEELSNIVKSQEHQIAQLTSENQQFKSKLEEMSSMYESATKSFKQEKEKLIDELTSREEELDLLLKGQESQMISLRSTNRDLNEQIQKHEEYNRELVDKIEDLSARYEDKIDNIRTEAEKMKEELTATRKENKSLISKYEKLRVKMVELKTKLGSSRSTVSKDLEEVSSRIATIEESYTLKEKAYIEKLEKQTKEYEDTLAKAMKENEEIVNALRIEVESLLEERKLADLPSDKVESLVSDLKIANAKVKAQKEGIEELKKDINDAKHHIADIQDAVSVVIDALKTSPTEDEVHTFSNKPSNPYDKQKERKEQHVSTILSNKLIKKLQDVAQALDVKTKLLDTRLQLNISTENNRKIQAKLSEKENLLEQAIVYVNKVQVEYEKMQRLLKSLEEEKQKLEVDLASRTKQLQLMKVEQYKRARATRSADDAPR